MNYVTIENGRPIVHNTVQDAAVAAANRLVYHGEMTDPPEGVTVARWRAMIDHIIRNGSKHLYS